MGHIDHRRAYVAVDPRQFRPRRDPQLRVEIGKRLVEEKDPRIARDRAAQGHPLALSTGELRGLPLEEGLDLQALCHFPHPAIDLPPLDTPQSQPESEVFTHGHVGIEGIVLEDHRDVPFLRGQTGHIDVIDQNAAPGRRLDPGDDAKQRALPAPGRSQQYDQFAARDP